MKRAFSLIGALLVSSVALAGASESVVIALRDRADVTGDQIRLADIAELRGGDAFLRQRLASFKVAPTPRLGASRTVRHDDLRRLLRRHLGEHPFMIEGSSVKVERPVAEYAGALFSDAARNHLLSHLQRTRTDLTKMDIAPVAEMDSVRGPVGQWRIVPRQIQGDGLAKRVCVWLDLDINGATYRTIPVWLRVSAFRSVLTVRRAHDFREPIAARDLVAEERDVAALRSAPLEAGKEGLRARRSIAAGATVLAADVESQPPVLADQEVDVRAVVGSIAIDTRAVAEKEGDVGDVIRVRNPSSTQTYVVRVVGVGKTLAIDR